MVHQLPAAPPQLPRADAGSSAGPVPSRSVRPHTSSPAPRTALGLALRAVTEDDAASAADHALTGELLLWVPAGTSLLDAADAARAPGRVVRVPLTRAHYTGGQLRVTTEPFLDPSCGCTVHGVFTGAVRADTLGGRFTLIGASTVAPRSGRWALVRRPAR